MPTRQDIIDVFEGDSDRAVAIFTQSVTVGQMDACGLRWPDAMFDPDMIAGLAVQTYRMFGIPTAHVPSRINVEAEAFGCTLSRGSYNSQPAVVGPVFAGELGAAEIPEDIMSVDEFLSSECIRNVVSAAGKVSEEDVFTVTVMNGPSAFVSNLVGMESMLLSMITDPELLRRWIDTAEPYVLGYRDLLSEVSDGIMVIDGASVDLTPPDLFDGMVGSRLKRLFKGMDVYSILHCCGNTLDAAPKLSSLGESVLSPESSGCMDEYVKAAGRKVMLAGAVNPVRTLLLGSPDDVRAQAKESSEAGYSFITPECGVPPMTPNENLRALSDALSYISH